MIYIVSCKKQPLTSTVFDALIFIQYLKSTGANPGKLNCREHRIQYTNNDSDYNEYINVQSEPVPSKQKLPIRSLQVHFRLTHFVPMAYRRQLSRHQQPHCNTNWFTKR